MCPHVTCYIVYLANYGNCHSIWNFGRLKPAFISLWLSRDRCSKTSIFKKQRIQSIRFGEFIIFKPLKFIQYILFANFCELFIDSIPIFLHYFWRFSMSSMKADMKHRSKFTAVTLFPNIISPRSVRCHHWFREFFSILQASFTICFVCFLVACSCVLHTLSLSMIYPNPQDFFFFRTLNSTPKDWTLRPTMSVENVMTN